MEVDDNAATADLALPHGHGFDWNDPWDDRATGGVHPGRRDLLRGRGAVPDGDWADSGRAHGHFRWRADAQEYFLSEYRKRGEPEKQAGSYLYTSDTNLFLKHLFGMQQKDFASAEASRGLCGRPLHSFAPHPYNRLE